jgi:hypothetical protein
MVVDVDVIVGSWLAAPQTCACGTEVASDALFQRVKPLQFTSLITAELTVVVRDVRWKVVLRQYIRPRNLYALSMEVVSDASTRADVTRHLLVRLITASATEEGSVAPRMVA